MKFVFTPVLFIITLCSLAQTSKDVTVSLTAVANSTTPSIILSWKADNSANYFAIYRKEKDMSTWDSISRVDKTIGTFTDTKVSVGGVYEYLVVKRTSGLGAISYVLAGINRNLPANRGKMILLIDKNYSVPLASEIDQLELDLRGDGWAVLRHEVNRTDAVTAVKQLVVNDYNADPQNVKAVYILGHVPVPYSGGFTVPAVYPPDGHTDHAGAWPSDLYYGTLNESIWTDNSFVDTSASRVQNRNKIGDGKFDIPYIYSDTVTLQVGRVDLFNLPAFAESDTALMRRYLNKAHSFKMGMNVGARRGYVSDNFGYFGGEAFASSGWRAMTPMFGDSVFPIASNNFFSTLNANSAQFVYGCGAGSYSTCGGIGATSNFASDSTLYNFGMLFGSYFGDWDAQNNFLRAPLASRGWTLSNSWSGRPYNYYHQMAMGENLGYCILRSQNNVNTYQYNIYPTFVYISLMGDPSLRMNPVLPVSNVVLSASSDKKSVTVQWTQSNDPGVTGYNIYRAKSKTAPFVFSGSVNATTFTFTDNGPYNGLNYFIVKAVKPETTSSGTYMNTSIGVMDTISAVNPLGIVDEARKSFSVYPNPARNVLYFSNALSTGEKYTVKIFTISGQQLMENPWNNEGTAMTLDISRLTPGIYMVNINSGAEVMRAERLIIY
jgi:hypothetical protein